MFFGLTARGMANSFDRIFGAGSGSAPGETKDQRIQVPASAVQRKDLGSGLSTEDAEAASAKLLGHRKQRSTPFQSQLVGSLLSPRSADGSTQQEEVPRRIRRAASLCERPGSAVPLPGPAMTAWTAQRSASPERWQDARVKEWRKGWDPDTYRSRKIFPEQLLTHFSSATALSPRSVCPPAPDEEHKGHTRPDGLPRTVRGQKTGHETRWLHDTVAECVHGSTSQPSLDCHGDIQVSPMRANDTFKPPPRIVKKRSMAIPGEANLSSTGEMSPFGMPANDSFEDAPPAGKPTPAFVGQHSASPGSPRSLEESHFRRLAGHVEKRHLGSASSSPSHGICSASFDTSPKSLAAGLSPEEPSLQVDRSLGARRGRSPGRSPAELPAAGLASAEGMDSPDVRRTLTWTDVSFSAGAFSPETAAAKAAILELRKGARDGMALPLAGATPNKEAMIRVREYMAAKNTSLRPWRR